MYPYLMLPWTVTFSIIHSCCKHVHNQRDNYEVRFMQKKKKFGVFNIVGIIICIVLALILINNVIIITKGLLNPDRPPEAFGLTSMIVMSGSMSGDAKDHIEVDDLIVTKKVDPSTLKVGDIISFMETETTVVTHRIIDIKEDGSFITKGDANNIEDTNPVTGEQIIGKFIFRIPKVGGIAYFMQTPIGMLLFIGIPVILYFVFDSFSRSKARKKKEELEKDRENEKEAMEEELKRLREMVDNQSVNNDPQNGES